MVICSIKKLVVLITTSFVFISSYSQTDLVSKKRNWGIVIQPVVFQKGKTEVAYGNMQYNTTNSTSMIYGVVFDLFQEKKLGLKTGLLFGTTPVINGKITLKKEDIYYNEDLFYDEKKLTSFLITYLPIKLTYKIPFYTTTLSFDIGPQFQYTYESEMSQGLVLIDYENTGEGVEVYASYVEGINKVYVDIQSSVGIYYKVGRLILNTSIIYNYGIKDKFIGEYQFGNLFVSKPTRGKLSISGSYLGLSLTVYLKKQKK